MMKFKQFTINTEELYKQFKNAVDKGYTYLRIEQPASNNTLHFKIYKDDDNDEIFVECAGDRTYNFFNNKIDNIYKRSYCVLSFEKRVFIPLPKVNGRKTSKKTTNKYTFDFDVEKFDFDVEKNDDFINELNKCNNDINFQTKEEYKIETLENTLDFLQCRLSSLEIRVCDVESNIVSLDKKKSNKFFI